MTGAGLLSLEAAQARLLALATPLPVERVDVPGTLGRFLAEPLLARRTQPASHVSAMDGYAVRTDDLAGPWQVIGESAAGHPYCAGVSRGQAVRISTGAVMPSDCGAVIVQEDTRREGDSLSLCGEGPRPADKHIRRQGADFRRDAELLPAGHRIGPAQIALALAAGHKHLAVHRPARIAIIDSGDELAADPECCAPHQTPASNGAMIAALLTPLPCETTRLGPVPDDLQALTTALGQAAGMDVIVTTGGASVGDHDLIRPALQAFGASLDFWKVAIKPGKPILVATRGPQVIIGLPGNPVSSMVTAILFLLPYVRAILGAAEPLPRVLPLPLAAALPPTGARREFVRAAFGRDGLTPVSTQDSGALGALSRTEALLDRAAGSSPAEAGDTVQAIVLD